MLDDYGMLLTRIGYYHAGECHGVDACVDCPHGWSGPKCEVVPGAGAHTPNFSAVEPNRTNAAPFLTSSDFLHPRPIFNPQGLLIISETCLKNSQST